METLSKLFGSVAIVKVMRLFLFNPNTAFDAKTIHERAKIDPYEARREVNLLERIGLVKHRVVTRKVGKRKVDGWSLNDKFLYLTELQNLLINTVLLKNEDIVRRIRKVGKIKLIVVSGLFLKLEEDNTRVDLLIVGDDIRKKALDTVIKTMEAEIGKELRYTALSTEDFHYRNKIYDKLIRDIFDYPYELIVDKLGLSDDK